MENCIEILAKSSSDAPHTVSFYLEENEISAFCSCPAGHYLNLCRHVMRIMAGDDSILYDSNQKKLLMKIGSHLQSTVVPLLLSELNKSEIKLENAKKNVREAKKNLKRVVLKK